MTLQEIAEKYFWTSLEITNPDIPKNLHIFTNKGEQNLWISIRDDEGRSYQGIFMPTMHDMMKTNWEIIDNFKPIVK